MTRPTLGLKIKTYINLGVFNLIRIVIYRLKMKIGWWQYFYPIVDKNPANTNFFIISNFETLFSIQEKNDKISDLERTQVITLADDLLDGYGLLFSRQRLYINAPPIWHKNPFTGEMMEDPKRHWSRIPDFSEKFGDIKTIWELSRGEWAPLLAQAYCLTQNSKYLVALNDWLKDWTICNPPNQGANWKCGQEVSFRALHTLLSYQILDPIGQTQPSDNLITFIEDHANRVAATLSYAIAQDNNHGISEASALLICGHWLLHVSQNNPKCVTQRKKYQYWAKIGSNNIENRMKRLVLNDGTFSQYSPTYQRLVLATLVQVFLWQDILKYPPFSKSFMQKTNLALNWLYQLTDPDTGDVPNLGANDGANVFRLSWHEPYRDFRPIISLLAARLGKLSPFGDADIAPLWFGQSVQKDQNKKFPSLSSLSIPFGGFEKLIAQDQKSWGLLRCANFKFRPSHADLNHFDLWVEGQNILLDSGSYSYAKTPPGAKHPLKTAFSHNTITFDNHDQMPSLGRFLYGAWPKSMMSYGNKDGMLWVKSDILLPDGNRHIRKVMSQKKELVTLWYITDKIEGHFKQATLRWHLPNLTWQHDNKGTCFTDKIKLETSFEKTKKNNEGQIKTVESILKPSLVSHYYLETTSCKVLEVSLKRDDNLYPDEECTMYVTTLVSLKQ